MTLQKMSPNQIRSAGLAALVKSLGPTGMARFLQQFDSGATDYTKDRENWLEKISVDEITAAIEKMRKTSDSAIHHL